MSKPGVTTRNSKHNLSTQPTPSPAKLKKGLREASPDEDIIGNTSSGSSTPEPMEIDEVPSTSDKVCPPKCKKNNQNDTNKVENKVESAKLNIGLVLQTGVLPFYDAQERIILVVDRAEDDAYTHFKIDGNSLPPLKMLKRSVEMFLQLKHSIHKKHQYALVFLNENSSTWELGFTSDHKKIITALNELDACEAEDIFDLKSLFNVIARNVVLPAQLKEDGVLIPPPYIVRIVLFYSRSYTIPQYDMTDGTINLLHSPYCILDVLMTHEPKDSNNNCAKILDVLQNIDKKGFGYFFSVERNTRLMCESVGKLLGNPLQRAVQNKANYKLTK